MSTWTSQISKEGHSRWKKQQVQRPWGPVNKSVSLGHAATEGPEALGVNFWVVLAVAVVPCAVQLSWAISNLFPSVWRKTKILVLTPLKFPAFAVA